MDDLIRRFDAIMAVQNHFNGHGFAGYQDGQEMLDRIMALPSAEPEIIYCFAERREDEHVRKSKSDF